MAKLEIKNIDKSFGDKAVLENINMKIADKEFVVLIGPSGCGKTTLLRIIAGLEEPTRGRVLVNNRDYTRLAPQQRNTSMVFQSYALFPHMNVYDNISYGLKIRKVSAKEIKRRVGEVADTLNLREQLSYRPAQLSGGQRQRVAMGRALVRNPDLFLFDEPLSNLDAKLRMHMRSEIKRLHQKFKNTIIYVTHDQVEAMTLADQVVILDRGRIVRQGKPMELYDKPNNLFVAGFIGSPAMNFIRGTVRREKGALVFHKNNWSLELPNTDVASVKGNDNNDNREKEVILGVRPEHFHLSASEKKSIKKDKEASTREGTEVRVTLAEHTGSQTVLHCLSPPGDPLIVLFHRRQNFGVGEKIRLSVKEFHLFSPRTQKRISR